MIFLQLMSNKHTCPGVRPMEFSSSESPADTTEQEMDQVFIAFGRIFSGKLTRGKKLYVLGPKHDPKKVLFIIMFLLF